MTIIKCKVFTNSKFEKIEFEETLIIFKFYINVPREKGKANNKLIELISRKLNLKKFELEIFSGFTTTIKLIKIKKELDLNFLKEKLLSNL